MNLIYKEIIGIGVLQNPQMVDLSSEQSICFEFDKKYAIMELNKIKRFPLENGKCSIKIREFDKGTNTIRLVGDGKTLPCQPICVFSVYDKLHCELATSLDTLKVIDELQSKVVALQSKVEKLEKANPEKTRTTLNDLIRVVDTLKVRLDELEAGYDPTVINQ